MSTEHDTPASASERFVPFHTSTDRAHWRVNAAIGARALLLDTHAPLADLAGMIEARAYMQLELLDVLLSSVGDDATPATIAGLLHPCAQELKQLAEVLSTRLCRGPQPSA